VQVGSIEKSGLYLVNAVATSRQIRLAVLIAAVAVFAFAVAVPYARVPLARMPAFIVSYQAALFFIDLITAVLLYEQSYRLRSAAVLTLAAGYLFDAFLIVPHTLSFPGAFAPTGLLGAKMQTTAWLYVFWHGGFPLFVMAYALLQRREHRGAIAPLANPGRAILGSVLGVALLAIVLAALATAGHDFLPVVMQGNDYSLLVTKGVSPAVWALTLVAMVMLWRVPLRVVDLWLMLVMWIWLFDIGLAAVIGSSRFDLGFYMGRLFGLIAAAFLLITLLIEMGRLYAGALSASSEVEKRFADLARVRRDSQPPVRETREAFVARQNIVRYREMLANNQLDDAQRHSIEQLLADEEAKVPKAAG
jgi:two-component system sensor histidine kinase/response regulator